MGIRRVITAVVVGTLVCAALVASPATAAGPAAPDGRTASAEADGTVHFEWSASQGASAYRLEWSADPEFPVGSVTLVDTYALDYVTRWQPVVGSTSDLYWRVSAFGSGISTSTLGDPSSTNLITTGVESAPQPIGPGVTLGVVQEIQYPDPTVFSWEPVAGAIAYQLEYTSDTLGGGSGILQQSVNGTQFSPANPLARVDSNGNSLTWKWRVRAQHYNGTTSSTTGVVYGAWSEEREFQITWDQAPTNLDPADEITTIHTDLSFSWDAVPGAAKYRVTLGTAVEGSGDSETILNPVTRDVFTTTYIPTAQVSDSTRFWQVTPLDYAGNPGTASAVHQYKKKWGTQDGPSAASDPGDAAPAGLTGSTSRGLDDSLAPDIYLSDLNIAWEPLQRATFYQLEVRDDLGNVLVCNTASTSATIVATYEDGLDNIGSSQVLDSTAPCLWNNTASKRIQEGRTYNWRVRGVDYTGSVTTGYQSGLPAGVQLSNWSQTRFFKIKADDRGVPQTYAVDLDLDAFTVDNSPSQAGQPAPLMSWSASGQLVSGVWEPVIAYEVILYKNPQRTAEIGHLFTPSTTLRLNGVLVDNTTGNPYYASVRPVDPGSSWTDTTAFVLGGIDNESVESFEWEKESQVLTGLATQTLTDGSVRLSWNPQSVTGLLDGGSRGYQIRIFNGATLQGVAKKIEFPFFMAQKPAASNDGSFPSTATDIPLPPGNNYTFEVAPLDANGEPGRLSKSATFSVGIATPVVSDAATVRGGSATLTWSAVPGALKYPVQYRRAGVQTWTPLAGISQTSAAINGLDQGNYEWQVRTQDASALSANVSDWSPVQQFTIGTGSIALQTENAAVLPLDDRVLRWSSDVDGVTRYQVQVAEDAAFMTNVKTYETAATSFAAPDALVSSKQYFWRVKALAEPSASPKVLATSATRAFYVRTAPAKVSGLVLAIAGTGLTASWSLLSGANTGTDVPITYVVQYREKSADSDWSAAIETETTASANSYTAAGLTTGTTYQFRVAGKNTEGTGPWSDVKELATATAPTGAPTLTITPQLRQLSLAIGKPSLNGGSAITGYRLSYRPTDDIDGVWTEQVIPVATTFVLTPLVEATSYDVSVAAINIVGDGPATVKSAITLGLASAPQTVVATRGDKKATVTWALPAAPNGTVTAYVLEYRLSTTTTWTAAPAPVASATSATIGSLVNGKTYQFRIAARTAVGLGEYSIPVSAMPAGKPIMSTTLTAVSSSTGTVTVAWGKANSNGSAITSYTVKYSTNGTTWYTLKTVGPTTYKAASTKGLHGKRIYFKVYATNALGVTASKTVSVIRK